VDSIAIAGLSVFLVLSLGFAWWWRAPVPAGTPVIPSEIQRREAEHTRYRAGEVASLAGLQLLRGDPTQNLVMHAVASERCINVFMQGAPHGVPIEFTYFSRVEMPKERGRILRKSWFNCEVRAFLRAPCAPFEVISRRPLMGEILARSTLPEHEISDPIVAAMFITRTGDAQQARTLTTALLKFQVFENTGVQLVCDGKSICYVLEQDRPPMLAGGLYFADAMVFYLSELAVALERSDV